MSLLLLSGAKAEAEAEADAKASAEAKPKSALKIVHGYGHPHHRAPLHVQPPRHHIPHGVPLADTDYEYEYEYVAAPGPVGATAPNADYEYEYELVPLNAAPPSHRNHYSPYSPAPQHAPPPAYPTAQPPLPVPLARPLRPRPRYAGALAPSGPPKCAKDKNLKFCLDDYDYPKYEIEEALLVHFDAITELYKDVLITTDNSVDQLSQLEEETYLCPTETAYVQPLRAVNHLGKWRVIVNRVKAHYDNLSQSARLELCLTPGETCPLTPAPYKTECVQKASYHRFLVYDPYDEYLPFSIDSFKLPTACACYAPEFEVPESDRRGQSTAVSLPDFVANNQPVTSPLSQTGSQSIVSQAGLQPRLNTGNGNGNGRPRKKYKRYK